MRSHSRHPISILVTGCAGFIGSNFVPYFLQKYPEYRIINLDLLTYAGSLENLKEVENHPRHIFIKGDICDRKLVEEIFNEYDIQGVIHFAAESHVDNSIKNPGVFIETNVNGTFTLLDVAYKHWMDGPFKYKERYLDIGYGEMDMEYDPESDISYSNNQIPAPKTQIPKPNTQNPSPISQIPSPISQPPRFHHISTDEVYGTLGETGLFTEETPYAPNSPYSASKAASDMIVRSYHHTYGMNTVITNCSNNYGPKQHDEKLIPTIIRNAIEGNPIPIYGDGKNIRDWLYVLDHCKGIDLAFHKGRAGETYNIGGRNERDNLYIANKICEILDELYPIEKNDQIKSSTQNPAPKTRNPEPGTKNQKSTTQHPKPKTYKSFITFVPDRPGHDRRYAIDAAKIEKELGWRADENFETGIVKTIKWYLERYNAK